MRAFNFISRKNYSKISIIRNIIYWLKMHSRLNVSYKRHCSFINNTKFFFCKDLCVCVSQEKNWFIQVDWEEVILSSLNWTNFAGAATNFAVSQTIICLAHRPLGSAFHPRRKSVRSPYARRQRSRACARAHTREDFSGNARSRQTTCSIICAIIESIRSDRHPTKTCSSPR